jgi:hypothetical protein
MLLEKYDPEHRLYLSKATYTELLTEVLEVGLELGNYTYSGEVLQNVKDSIV